MAQPDDQENLSALFSQYDRNSDGLIDREEYAPILRALESAEIPRAAFLFHRVVRVNETGLNPESFAERLTEAGAAAEVSVEALVRALQVRLIETPVPSPAILPASPATPPEDLPGEELAPAVLQLTHDVLEKYSVEPVPIGAGGFAKVFLGTRVETGEEVAIKVVDLSTGPSTLREMVIEEVMIMARASHPHIVGVSEFGDSSSCIWMAMTFMAGGDLQEHIKTHAPKGDEISELCARGIFLQLLHAVDYLHNELEVVHRDLKPENVLLRESCQSASDIPHVKIADFGLSTQYDSKRMMKLHCGTPAFFAPELINGSGYTRAVDMWSLGLILFLLLSSRLPFRGSTIEKLTQRICAGEFEFSPSELWSTRAESVCDLIQRLLDVDPLVRYSAKEALEHPWVLGKDSVEGMALTVFEMLKLGK